MSPDLLVDAHHDLVRITVPLEGIPALLHAWAQVAAAPSFGTAVGVADQRVVIQATADEARLLAAGWEQAYRSGDEVPGGHRDLYVFEAADLRHAAYMADLNAGRTVPVAVPVRLVSIPGGAA